MQFGTSNNIFGSRTRGTIFGQVRPTSSESDRISRLAGVRTSGSIPMVVKPTPGLAGVFNPKNPYVGYQNYGGAGTRPMTENEAAGSWWKAFTDLPNRAPKPGQVLGSWAGRQINKAKLSGSWFDQNTANNLTSQMQAYGAVDPNSVFEQYYKGLKAMGSIGIESNKRYQQDKLRLENLLRNSKSGLSGNLNGIEEARLFNILNQDKSLYRTNSAEIQRMKEYALIALKHENDKRASERAYLDSQRGFVGEALRQALDRSRDERDRANTVLAENIFNIGSRFTGMGSGVSRGRFKQNEFQFNDWGATIRALDDRDAAARLDRDKAMRDIEERLSQLNISQQADTSSTLEDIAKLDSNKKRLDAEQNKIGYNFMAEVAKIRAAEKQRQDEQNLMRFYSQLEQNRINQLAIEAQQRANQEAFFGAIAQQQQAAQMQNQFWGGLRKSDFDQLLGQAWRTGDVGMFKKVKFIGTAFGHY